MTRFDLGHVFGCSGELFGQNSLIFLGLRTLGGHAVHVVDQLLLTFTPLRELGFDLLDLRFDAVAPFGHETQFGFDARDFGVGRVHGGLCAVQIVGQFVMLCAARFELGFGMA